VQGHNSSILDMYDEIESFQMKVDFWLSKHKGNRSEECTSAEICWDTPPFISILIVVFVARYWAFSFLKSDVSEMNQRA
jgi:hypothetical protein